MLRWLCLVYAGDIAGGNHTARPALAQQLWAEGAVPRADASDPWLACAVGDPVRLREQLARDPAWVHRTGGPLQLPPLLAVAHSSLAQLPAFAPGLLACADLLLRAGADYQLLTTNAMDEIVMATPAISDGLLVIRTVSQVVGIAEGEKLAPHRRARRHGRVLCRSGATRRSEAARQTDSRRRPKRARR